VSLIQGVSAVTTVRPLLQGLVYTRGDRLREIGLGLKVLFKRVSGWGKSVIPTLTDTLLVVILLRGETLVRWLVSDTVLVELVEGLRNSVWCRWSLLW
jgi:hypothetical protein